MVAAIVCYSLVPWLLLCHRCIVMLARPASTPVPDEVSSSSPPQKSAWHKSALQVARSCSATAAFQQGPLDCYRLILPPLLMSHIPLQRPWYRSALWVAGSPASCQLRPACRCCKAASPLLCCGERCQVPLGRHC
jgi:hypothetical protein